MKKPKVISVFAGLGKTTVGKKYSNVCDLQSSPFRCDYSSIKKEDFEKMKCSLSRIPNSGWPNNYLTAILEAMKIYDVVLVPSSMDVRTLLIANNIEFLFVLPSKNNENRKKLLERYALRGNNSDLINEVINYFDNWSGNQKDYNYPIKILDNDKYLEDLLLEEGYII